VAGGEGDDVMEGGGGDDKLNGNAGTDICDGEEGPADSAANCEITFNVP